MPSATRVFCWVVGLALLVQGISTLVARLVPAVDRAFPALLAHTQMVPSHSMLHIVTGLIAMFALYRGGPRGAFHFTVWFSLLYAGLAVLGWLTASQLGLGLQPFDHPFHLFIGVFGLVAVVLELRRGKRV